MVEGAVSEGQGERVRLSKLNPVREPAACGQAARDFDEGGREVDRRYSATAFGCEIARRAPEPATNFEHVHARLVCAHVPHARALLRYPDYAAGRTATDRDGWASRDPPQRRGGHLRSVGVPADRRNSLELSPRRRSC